MWTRIAIIVLLPLLALTLHAQEWPDDEKPALQKKSVLRFQGDSRQTIINRKSVGIYGVRLGVLFEGDKEVGLGVYSSNLFGVLGNTVEKNYLDNSVVPPVALPASVGFHYFSIYGEYTILRSRVLLLTTNSQVGHGWVDIDFTDNSINKDRLRERKWLVEHSVKIDVKTFEWLRVMGGVGYRYLTSGERQIKDTFNAPIYILGFSIDFKKLLSRGSKSKNGK